MSYFQNVKFVPYRFGTSEEFTLHQNLTAYVDLIDQVRDNNAFYQTYTILDGDRPDVLSQKLYNSSKYYWTFFLLNDLIRERGWPLTIQGAVALAQKERTNTVLTTLDDLTGVLKVGATVNGNTSSAVGTVTRRRLDLGQIFVKTDDTFLSGETVTSEEDGIFNTITLSGATHEYNATWQYVNDDQEQVDIDPSIGPGAELTPVTYTDRYIAENDELKQIIVIKPDAVGAVFEQFQAARN